MKPSILLLLLNLLLFLSLAKTYNFKGVKVDFRLTLELPELEQTLYNKSSIKVLRKRQADKESKSESSFEDEFSYFARKRAELPTRDFDKVLLVGGKLTGQPPVNDTKTNSEIINLDHSGKQCEDIPPYPMQVWLATGQNLEGGPTVCGGLILPENLTFTPLCYQYQKASKSWVQIARLPLGRFGAASSINGDGEMWITGGKIANRDGEVIQVVDPKLIADSQINMKITETTLLLKDQKWVAGPDLPKKFHKHCQLTLNNGDVFFGGADGTKRAYLYIASTAYFKPLAFVANQKDSPSCALVNSMGEQEIVMVYMEEVEIYNVRNEFWRPGPKLSNFLRGGATVSTKRGFYLFGGETMARSLDNSVKVEHFDDLKYQWVQEQEKDLSQAMLHLARKDMVALPINDELVDCKERACESETDCAGISRPLCNLGLGQCVQCHSDENCDRHETCSSEHLSCSCTCTEDKLAPVNRCPCLFNWTHNEDTDRFVLIGGTPGNSVSLVTLPDEEDVPTACDMTNYPTLEVSNFVDPVATFLGGEILVCGGGGYAEENTEFSPLGTCKGVKSGYNNNWKSRAGMTQARMGAASTLIGPEAWLVTGGIDLGNQDKTTEIWTKQGGFQAAAEMPGPKSHHCLLVIGATTAVALGE